MDNSFAVGIEPGGLRNRTDIMLLVCYILKTINAPLAHDDLIESITSEGLANYFDVTESIKSLLDNHNIMEKQTKSGVEYTVTDSGIDIAKTLETTLPLSVRSKSVNAAVKSMVKSRRKKENRVEIEKCNSGFVVTCTVLDRDIILMSTKLRVADALQAEEIRNNFLNDPVGVYGGTVALLTGNLSTVIDSLSKK